MSLTSILIENVVPRHLHGTIHSFTLESIHKGNNVKR